MAKQRLTQKNIRIWAQKFQVKYDRWPRNSDDAKCIPKGVATWTTIDNALRFGRRGLKGGQSLPSLFPSPRRRRKCDIPPSGCLGPREMIAELGISRRTLWRLVARGLPVVRRAHLVFYPRRKCIKWHKVYRETVGANGITAIIKLQRRLESAGQTLGPRVSGVSAREAAQVIDEWIAARF